MEFTFEARVALTLEHKEKSDSSKHICTSFNLVVPEGLDADCYLDEEGIVNKEGSKVLSNVLIQGLVGNIHLAHQSGFRDSAEHLRWIISELEKGFIVNASIYKSNFK